MHDQSNTQGLECTRCGHIELLPLFQCTTVHIILYLYIQFYFSSYLILVDTDAAISLFQYHPIYLSFDHVTSIKKSSHPHLHFIIYPDLELCYHFLSILHTCRHMIKMFPIPSNCVNLSICLSVYLSICLSV